MDEIHPEAGAEQGEGHQQQQQALVPAAAQEIALGAGGEISMAMVATMKISTPCQKSTPISSRSVLKMNRNGSAAVRRL